ncbi:MAG: TlpA family protein disulfide reductase [Gammaproteobacteria bacterium]|nr:TlpA family protein disulfide reductase [Gammaproteobacteria bacterium]
MKNTYIALIILFALLTSSQSLYAAAGSDFSLKTTSGKTVKLSKLKGKVVYVDFWASWCAPCRKSFPWMNNMHARYKAKGLKIIAISLDSDRKVTKKFLRDNPALFTVAYDSDGKVADKYGVQVMPTSYLIGRNGELLATHKGFRKKHADAIEAEIKKALK